MKRKQYALFDSAAKMFLNPFSAQNDGDAIRVFTSWVNDPKKESNVALYPQQFTLFYLGEYDDQHGKFIQEEVNKELIQGISVQQEEEKKFTLNDLVTMLEMRLKERSAPEISKSHVEGV